ncbi:MAG: ribokinase [Phycicoccus sp.]|nr:ribokinase [Phycicoccus sp.]
MTSRGAVVVVGSINLDIAMRVTRIPTPGETVLASAMIRSGGGKGANQAVAAALAGAETTLIGCVGGDNVGAELRAALASAGVRTDLLDSVEAPTGTALISVDSAGENAIVVAPGANALLGMSTPQQHARIAAADVVLAQLEIPLPAVIAAAHARAHGKLFILNAAPSAPLPAELWARIDVLVVNEHEAADLAASIAATSADGVERAIELLLGRVPCVLVTLGSAGAILARRGTSPVRVPAPVVTAIDTTAAGDTFCGVFAAALARGNDAVEAVRLASAAASLAVQRPGAQASVPTAEETRAQRDRAYPPASDLSGGAPRAATSGSGARA